MDNSSTVIHTNSYHITVDNDMVAKDPIRALKKGSLVRLNFSALLEIYWRPHDGCWFNVPYCSDVNSFEKKLRVNRIKDHVTSLPKNITFLILDDLDNLNTIHGWMSVAYEDDRVDMAKGWFNYDMLIRCIDFSTEDDSLGI